MKRFNYENQEYLNKLDKLSAGYYSKYISTISKFLPDKKGFFLEVGCGNGIVLSLLRKKGYTRCYGVDISKLFINEAKHKKIPHVYAYDGVSLPFKDNYFDLISSFNVLEHTENPSRYLREQIKKVKKDGIIIVGCPNFLSIFSFGNHPQLKGLSRKILNTTIVIKKMIKGGNGVFKKMEPIIRTPFEYDDDAIVITNLIDLKSFFEKNKCRVLYETGFLHYDTKIYNFINTIPFFRYLMPSCFIVVQKK